MSGPSSPLIENYLKEAGFWHTTTIDRGWKLDSKLISALIERWRPEMHAFHLPCGECTITLEDVQLQLGLPMDGAALTGSVQFADWEAICYDLLGAIPDNIYRGRIEMGWLRDTFPEPRNDSTELERIRYAQAYILKMIGGYLMPNLSRNLVHLRWLLKLFDFRAGGELSWGSAVLATLYWRMWNHPASYVRIPIALEYIRLLLDQQLEAQTIILDEFFQNLNIWHVNVPLVNYAIIEMHQTDRVLQQFGFRQPIPEEPEVLDDQHRIDLRQTNMNWLLFWSEYIEIWENRYDHISNREPIIILELACTPDYMPWFRIHGKPYLLSEEQVRQQIRVERER
ncbi:hypothetical protein CXB51_001479 [Gossypium anomalum]|uniref:Aminotransferase-like plant mobile domain-containing protein n=1 Tax=Gossypium anomalum TaxID=47600 RepID=A0A8J6D9L1_9ROSI|nr:hypothetical protein CXB51_001479 [Gossypium anomalum]